MSKVYIGDIGTKLSLDIGENVSTATVKRIYYLKPDGKEGWWAATLETGNLILSYTTKAGDLDVAGSWKLQAYVEMTAWKGLSETITLVVNKRFG
jgi:hypothetical protein